MLPGVNWGGALLAAIAAALGMPMRHRSRRAWDFD